MRSIIIIPLIFIFQLSFSQEVNNLDKKNGFKDFTFGQELLEFKSIASNPYSDDSIKPVIREYTGSKHKELFDIDWHDLVFGFCDNKLYEIEIVFSNSNDYKYESLLNNLEILFGKPSKSNSLQLKESNFKRYNRWEGENTYMYLRYFAEDYRFIPKCNTCNITLVIHSKEVENECLKNDF